MILNTFMFWVIFVHFFYEGRGLSRCGSSPCFLSHDAKSPVARTPGKSIGSQITVEGGKGKMAVLLSISACFKLTAFVSF